jgi:hypothetical protein
LKYDTGLVTLFARVAPTQHKRSRTASDRWDAGGGLAMRSRIEVYWNSIDTAPAGEAVQVRVTDGSGDEYLLPYPCKLTPDGWVNAVTGSPLSVRPTYWKLYVETLPRKWKRKNPAVEQPGG